MYEIGKPYIWQNQVGEMAHLNGTECMVVEAPAVLFDVISQRYKLTQETDTYCDDDRYSYTADPGDLKEKPSLATSDQLQADEVAV